MTRYIEDLNENTAPVAGDYLLCYDASAGSTDKDRKVNVGKFAVLATANTFTVGQVVAPTAMNNIGVRIDMPTSNTVMALNANYAAMNRFGLYTQATFSAAILWPDDLGNTVAGPYMAIGRNSNATVPSAGVLQLYGRTGTVHSQWMDASGNLRTHSAAPTSAASDTSGTVIGTQTSSLDSKEVIEEFTDYDGALAAILAAPVYDFKYKSGAFNGEKFTGLITDYAPLFGMDRDEAHPAGKSLNEITSNGYLFAALKAVMRRLHALEAAA